MDQEKFIDAPPDETLYQEVHPLSSLAIFRLGSCFGGAAFSCQSPDFEVKLAQQNEEDP